MSEEKESTPPAVAAVAAEEKPAEDPPVDLAKQNEQTVAQTNAINDAVKATQVWMYDMVQVGMHTGGGCSYSHP